MKFLTTDWLLNGPGSLYSPPFVSKCLLYRLHDIDCSLLVHHEETVTSSPGKWVGRTFAIETVARVPDVIFVCHAPSAECSLAELRGTAPARISISRHASSEHSFSNVAIKVEPVELQIVDMVFVAGDNGRSVEYQIANTSYSVKTSARVQKMDKYSKGAFPLWKVSVLGGGNTGPYDFFAEREWELAAMSTGELRPVLEMRLAR